MGSALSTHGSGILVGKHGHGDRSRPARHALAARAAPLARAAAARAGADARRVPRTTRPAPPGAGGAAGGDVPAAPVGHQAGPALQLQRRRGDALRPAGDRVLLATTSTRTTSSTRRPTPTCCTSSSSCGSAAPTRSRRAYATDPTSVFVVARVVAAVLGTVAVWLTYLAGARFFNRNVGLLAAAIFGVRVPARLLQPPGAQRRPDAGARGAVAVRHRRRAAPRAAGATTCSPVSASGSPRRPSTPAGSRSCACWRRSSATPPAARPGARCAACALGAGASRCSRSCSPTRTRCSTSPPSTPASRRRRRSPPARTRSSSAPRPGSGIGYYLWTFTWGLGWGPALAALGGAVLLLVRRRLGDGAGAAAGADRVHHLHGRPAALLRPLADADLPDRRAPRRLRRGRARRAG